VLIKIKPSNGEMRTIAGSSADADACTDIKTTVDGHLLAVVQNELLHFDEDDNHLHVVSSRSMQIRLEHLAQKKIDIPTNDVLSGIGSIYDELIDVMVSCACSYVPRCPKNFFKFWWDEEPKSLKEASVNTDMLWKAAGRPRSGPIFKERQSGHFIVNVFAIISEILSKFTQTTFTRPYCTKTTLTFGRLGAQNLTLILSVIRSMGVSIIRQLPTSLWTTSLASAPVLTRHTPKL